MSPDLAISNSFKSITYSDISFPFSNSLYSLESLSFIDLFTSLLENKDTNIPENLFDLNFLIFLKFYKF